VRLSDTYGPWQTSNNLIPHIISSILDNKNINIYGSGYQTRDWTHVFDICSGLFHVINNGTDGNIYNITSAHEFSNIEIAQIVCNTIGRGHELIKHVEKEVSIRFSMSNSKLKELGWYPKFKLKEGIYQTCQWYLNNKYFLRM
jgi:dTDP-glucose 4,6-dehydratase